MASDHAALLRQVLTDAEHALRDAWGASVDLLPLNASEAVAPRSTVVRCLVRSAAPETPVTVIVKSTRGAMSPEYNMADTGPQSAAGRLLNDWAGGRFLSDLSSAVPLCPRVYAGDRVAGVIVIEDLGSGDSLGNLLTGEDAHAAGAALEAYARGLGQLHAATAKRAEEFVALRSNLGLVTSARDRFVQAWPTQNLPKMPELCQRLQVDWPDAARAELDAVVEAIGAPGAFEALSQGDTCPDNHRLLADSVRFLDFEFCGFRHALLDLAFIWLPFPTCQDVRRIPREFVQPAESAYRTQFVVDDDQFVRGMLQARTWWTMLSLGAYLPQALESDRRVGTATLRQRLLLWLETFVEDPDPPALTGVAHELWRTLKDRWNCEDSPLYPAFSRAPGSLREPAGST